MAERKSKVADASGQPKAPAAEVSDEAEEAKTPAAEETETPAADEPKTPAAEEAKAPAATKVAPIDAPQPKPVPPIEPSPFTAANAVTPHAPFNEEGTRLLDEQGEECTFDECLSYPGPDDPGILVTVIKRVYREYTPLNARTKVTQLLYPEGARITKDEAKRLKQEVVPPPAQAGG